MGILLTNLTRVGCEVREQHLKEITTVKHKQVLKRECSIIANT